MLENKWQQRMNKQQHSESNEKCPKKEEISTKQRENKAKIKTATENMKTSKWQQQQQQQ